MVTTDTTPRRRKDVVFSLPIGSMKYHGFLPGSFARDLRLRRAAPSLGAAAWHLLRARGRTWTYPRDTWLEGWDAFPSGVAQARREARTPGKPAVLPVHRNLDGLFFPGRAGIPALRNFVLPGLDQELATVSRHSGPPPHPRCHALPGRRLHPGDGGDHRGQCQPTLAPAVADDLRRLATADYVIPSGSTFSLLALVLGNAPFCPRGKEVAALNRLAMPDSVAISEYRCISVAGGSGDVVARETAWIAQQLSGAKPSTTTYDSRPWLDLARSGFAYNA